MTIYAKKLSGIKKLIGLIGQKRSSPVYLETRYGIHTFGLRSPIDILIINKKNYVVKLQQNLKPNTIFFWNPYYNRVLELPPNYIIDNRIRNGLKINLKF